MLESKINTKFDSVTVSSDVIYIEIFDPCVNTKIMSNMVPNMSSSIGEQALINLKNHNWPWYDSVDLATSEFGSDKCGLSVYFVTDESGGPAPFVEFRNDGSLILKPDFARDGIGARNCQLHAQLMDYSHIIASEPFGCDIPNCASTILPNGARAAEKITTFWGDETAAFDVANEIAKYSIEPNCGQAINFEVLVLDQDLNPGFYPEVMCDTIAC